MTNILAHYLESLLLFVTVLLVQFQVLEHATYIFSFLPDFTCNRNSQTLLAKMHTVPTEFLGYKRYSEERVNVIRERTSILFC